MRFSSLKSKFGWLIAFIATVNLLTLGFVSTRLNGFESRFTEYHQSGVELERQTLKVAEQTNFVSRLTRSIMLGDDLDKNLEALDKTINGIEKSFDAMKVATAAMDDAAAKQKFDHLVATAQADTLAFVNDGRMRMSKLKGVAQTPETLSAAWADYHKAATPLANKARESFKPLSEDAKAYLGGLREVTDGSLKSLQVVLTIVQLLATVISVLLLVYLGRQIIGPVTEAATISHQIAKGDLTPHIGSTDRDDECAQMLSSLRDMQANISRMVTAVRGASHSVSTASAEIASGNNDLCARTENQASALAQTAASMDELGAAVQQTADSARQADQLAQKASSVAVQGGQVVSQVVQTMKEINDSSQKIADIISVIDSIAFQTNILALNAAVEAARAGEQGRGFAVVAAEVRSLASRSAEAAKQIKTLITTSVGRVEQGTALVDQAGATMQEIVDSIQRVTNIMGEISSASAEQSSGVAQVGMAINQMDQTTQQNAALVEEMAAATSSLNTQAQELVQTVAVFKLSVN
jgi:methyl-accepting chemotaxis protein